MKTLIVICLAGLTMLMVAVVAGFLDVRAQPAAFDTRLVICADARCWALGDLCQPTHELYVGAKRMGTCRMMGRPLQGYVCQAMADTLVAEGVNAACELLPLKPVS